MQTEMNLKQMQKCVAEFKRRKLAMHGSKKNSGLSFSSNALQFFLAGAQYGIDLIIQSDVPNEKSSSQID